MIKCIWLKEGVDRMFKKFQSNSLYLNHRDLLLCILDLTIVFFSFLLTFWAYFDFSISTITNIYFKDLFVSAVVVIAVYAFGFFVFKIYKSLWKYIGPVESVRIGTSVVFSTIILVVIATFMELESYYYSIIFFGGVLSALLMMNVRLAYRLLRRKEMQITAIGNDNAVIIGAGDAGYILLKEIIQNDNMEVKVIGFVDDLKMNRMVAGIPVLGSTYDLPEIVQKHSVKKAYIAIPSAEKKDIRRIVDLCQALKLETKIMKEADVLFDDDKTEKKYPMKDVSIEDLLGRGEIKLDQSEITSYITGKVIAVTGAGGSIGSELCRQIAKFKPEKLIMIDISENYLYMLEQEFNRNKEHGITSKDIEIVSLIASIREYKSLNDIFVKYHPDVVYHAAAHKHVPLMETRPQEAIKNNVFGTNNVIQCCIANKVSRFIMISTDKAVNPTNVMGATKRMTELLLQANGNNGVTKMAAVRFGNVLGSNGSVIPIFKKQIAEGGPVTITDKRIIRYFMTIPEAAQLVLQAGFYADRGEIFVLDMGEPVKILDLAEKLIRLSGFRPYEDIEIKEIGLRPGEKMFEELKLDGETTTRTKNDLIFRNNVMPITLKEVEEKLETLHKSLYEGDKPELLKETLLQLIQDKEPMHS